MRIVLLLSISIFISACASNSEEVRGFLKIDHVAKVHLEDGERITYPGESIAIKNKDLPVLVEAPERVSMVLLPVEQTVDKKIELKKLEKSDFEEASKKYLNQKINSSISSIFEVMELVEQTKYSQALDRVEKLRLDKPEIAYFYFLEASIQHQMGSKAKARETLEEGIRVYGNDPKAIKYLKELSRD